MYRIEVCGGIASGKTTLTNILPKKGFFPLFENFQTNPFWRAFYSNPNQFSFETEITFLLQHYHQIITCSPEDKVVVSDYSFILDRAYVDVTLQDSTKEAFLAVYDEVMNRLTPPSLVIYLKCSPEIELERVRERGRSVESGINLEYLDSLNSSICRHLDHVSSGSILLTIDSAHQDFAHDEQSRRIIIEEVMRSLS